MPQVGFGEKLQTGGSQFFKLEAKGDSLHFRLLDAPFIEGKHFFQTDDGWDIQPCPRINEGQECEHCKKFFSFYRKAKKETDKTLVAQLKKEGDYWKPSTFVYYPVINRETHEFTLFQTTVGVRTQIEDEYKLGTKVLDVDFKVMRTENPGSYYKVSRVDSAETEPLNEEELQAVETYKQTNIADLVNGRYDEDSGTAFESNSEVQEDAADNF